MSRKVSILFVLTAFAAVVPVFRPGFPDSGNRRMANGMSHLF